MADTLKDITELLPRVERSSGSPDSVWLEVGIIIGVSAVIVVGFMIWAKFFRNTGRRRSRKSLQVMGQGRSEDEKISRERSRRHRQSDRYTQRNPTLAEKGGLPPVRRDVEEPPAGPPASSLPS